MKRLFALLITALVSSSAFAGYGNGAMVPEIDGTLSVLMIALVGGLAVLFKKNRN